MKIDINILEKYYKSGLLYKHIHPIYDLIIWNYTPKVPYDKLWDEFTIKCRGLITDNNSEIISHCLPKFFNWEELNPNDIPNESFTMTDKMDGSLGNIFYYNSKWLLASRGSFISEQSIKGSDILLKYNIKSLNPNYNYIVEIIYPENRIICDYGNLEKLFIITSFNVNTGEECSVKNMISDGWDVVKEYDGKTDFKDIKTMISDNEEGYVIKFKSGFRMKIKGREYFRLHSIITKISNRIIWEYLKDNKSFDSFIERVPDEFYMWVKEQISNFKLDYQNIKDKSYILYHDIFRENLTRKEFADIVMTKDKYIRKMLFGIYDGKNIDKMIWDILYPKYSNPFFKKNEF